MKYAYKIISEKSTPLDWIAFEGLIDSRGRQIGASVRITCYRVEPKPVREDSFSFIELPFEVSANADVYQVTVHPARRGIREWVWFGSASRREWIPELHAVPSSVSQILKKMREAYAKKMEVVG